MSRCLTCLVKRVRKIDGSWNNNVGEPSYAICSACRRSICLSCIAKNNFYGGWYHAECIPILPGEAGKRDFHLEGYIEE